MTKKKKSLIIIIAVILALLVAGGCVTLVLLCKKKVEPTVVARVEQQEYYAGNALKTVRLSLVDGSTEGTICWENENEVLKLGSHEYNWKFTPKDTSKFLGKTGKATVVAEEQTLVEIEIKTAPTKTSGYKAFDELDTSGLVLNTIYDSGSINQVQSGFSVVYASVDASGDPFENLRAGDTFVTIEYMGLTTRLDIDEVGMFEVETPQIVGTYVYDGSLQTANFGTSEYYTAYQNTATNAGNYDVYFELVDTNNCVWKQTGSQVDISVKFVIEKAEQTVDIQNFNGAYDGNGHSASVTSANATLIYYSFNELNEQNYADGSVSPLEVSDITTGTTIYYYAVGNANFKDKTGALQIVINKAHATVMLNNAFGYLTENAVELSDQFVTVHGVLDEVIDATQKVTFTYYVSYSNETTNQKTTASNSGASGEGQAPKNKGTYYVVAKFEGNDTYLETLSNVAVLVIDDELEGFYAKQNEGYFEWIVSGLGYATFEKKTIGSSFVGLAVESTLFGNGLISIENNDLILKSSNGKTYVIEMNAEKDELTVSEVGNASNVMVLQKYVEPSFVGIYQHDIVEGDPAPSTIEFYVENGNLKFKFSYYNKGSIQIMEGNASYESAPNGAVVTINHASPNYSLSYTLDYVAENKTMILDNFLNPNYAGVFKLIAE